jgi:hypothetical protein
MNAGLSPSETADMHHPGSVTAEDMDSLKFMAAMRNEPPVPLTVRDQVIVFDDSAVARVEAYRPRSRCR